MNKLNTSSTYKILDEEMEKIIKLFKLITATECFKIELDPIYLAKYLHYTDWDVEKAFKSLNIYMDFKAKFPKLMSTKSPEYYKDFIFNVKSRFLLPHLDKNGRFVLIYKFTDELESYPDHFFEQMQLDDIIYEAITSTRIGQTKGVTVIFDGRNLTMSYVKLLKPKNVKGVHKKMDLFPMKSRVIHFIQSGFFFNLAFSILSPIFGSFFEKNAIFHTDPKADGLRESIGKDILPEEFGGPTENSLDPTILYNFLVEHKDLIEQAQNYKKQY